MSVKDFIHLKNFQNEMMAIEVSEIAAIVPRKGGGANIYLKACEGGKRLKIECPESVNEVRFHIEEMRRITNLENRK